MITMENDFIRLQSGHQLVDVDFFDLVSRTALKYYIQNARVDYIPNNYLLLTTGDRVLARQEPLNVGGSR